MKINLNTGDTIYEIQMNNYSGEVMIGEMKILCVGEQLVFAKGIDTIASYEKETIFSLSTVNTVDPSKVIESKFFNAWADSLEKAEELKATIEKVLEFKRQFKLAI